MNFELIVAFNKKNVIGTNNKIPWYVPEDLKQFRKTTKHQIVVMGRKTFESLPNGPLIDRINIVITNKTLESDNSELYFCNFDDSFDLLEKLQKETDKKVFIIGGHTIYNQYFKYCTQFHITVIDDHQDGDVFFSHTLEMLNEQFQKIEEKIFISDLNIYFTRYLFKCL
jgi:dihydrofolate reductase